MKDSDENFPTHYTITPRLVATTRHAAFKELVDTLGMEHPEAFLMEVEAREKLQTTDAGCGVAFPHARTVRVGEIVLAMGRSEAGIPFADGGTPVHFIFLFGTPHSHIAAYLECVAFIIRRLRNAQVHQALLHAQTRETFRAALLGGTGA